MARVDQLMAEAETITVSETDDEILSKFFPAMILRGGSNRQSKGVTQRQFPGSVSCPAMC
jgi:hypothetical protein